MRISDWSSDVCSSDLLASLGFGLFRPGFTAGASLSVPRRDQGSVAGMTASIHGSAYIVSPAIGVMLSNWHPMIASGLKYGIARVGTESGSKCGYWGSPDHSKKNNNYSASEMSSI